ncbi:MAG: hypothetical protein AB9869_13960 [Verrucomicrobiia bacterium]
MYGVDSLRWEIGHYSRAVRHDPRVSYLTASDALLRGLVEFRRQQASKPVIINAGDPYIDFIAAHRDELLPYYVLTDSMRPDVNTVLLNKRTFYERCLSLGVEVPFTCFARSEEEAVSAAKAMRYPAIVKPVHSHVVRKHLRGRKLVEVSTAGDLLHWWRRMKEWGSDSILQEVIVGPESNLVVAGLYMDRQQQCLSLFTGTKNRQYPPMYGSGSYMESRWLPEIAELSIGILQRFRYHGICGTEFKWDPRDRKWKLIEINCRPTLWFALTRAAGVDVVWDAYCDLIGRPNPVHIGSQRDGVRWQLLARDLVSAIHFLKRGELTLKEFCRTTLSPFNKTEAVLSWNDWGANLGYFTNTVMQCWTHFVKRH